MEFKAYKKFTNITKFNIIIDLLLFIDEFLYYFPFIHILQLSFITLFVILIIENFLTYSHNAKKM